jgi:hypothetical protein
MSNGNTSIAINTTPWGSDIRNLHTSMRSALCNDRRVSIFIGDDVVADAPIALLKSASVKFDKIYHKGTIKLPTGTDKGGVVHLVDYLQYITRIRTKPCDMSSNMPTYEALSVCAAAHLMGMDKYTDNVYKTVEWIFRADPPFMSYEDLDALIAFEQQHVRLFNFVVDTLANRVWMGMITDPEEFGGYLLTNPTLDCAIKEANKARDLKLRRHWYHAM